MSPQNSADISICAHKKYEIRLLTHSIRKGEVKLTKEINVCPKTIQLKKISKIDQTQYFLINGTKYSQAIHLSKVSYVEDISNSET